MLVAADLATGGAVVGEFLWPLVLYHMLSVNIDFWEMYWLANHRSAAMFCYSAGRLIARLLVVTGCGDADAERLDDHLVAHRPRGGEAG